MQRVIQFSEVDEARAIQVLFRQFAGTMLPGRVYIVNDEAVRALSEAGIEFTELSRESQPPVLDGVVTGERV